MSPKYIVIDGIDGGGKSSLFKSLKARFVPHHQGEGLFFYTREPGGTELAEQLREIILREEMDPFTELCLFNAQRKEVRNRIAKALEMRIHIISDRSDSSSFAYQIRGRELPLLEEVFWILNKHIPPQPTFYIFLDLSPSIASERLRIREGSLKKGDRFDRQSPEFFERVRSGFREFSTKVKTPCVYVSAEQSAERVFDEVSFHITNHLGM